MSILITGGAGYIGSVTVAALLQRGKNVIIVDNLQQGHRQAVLGGKFYCVDIRDQAALADVFAENQIEGVIHFAASSLVGESMRMPGKYYHNNVVGALSLLQEMHKAGVKHFVFSSTAAVYGEPNQLPIDEYDPVIPTNTYGETKLTIEKMCHWFDVAYGIKTISLRYFNAAGAPVAGQLGEHHIPETHLIPIILQVALGQREFISVFGDDYETEDGTCIRDYIHVSDLAEAHILALERLHQGRGSQVFNLGSGKGFSVNQVVNVAREITGHPIPIQIEQRRNGDPAVLVASIQRALNILNWTPHRSLLKIIMQDAWNWHVKHPDGFRAESEPR